VFLLVPFAIAVLVRRFPEGGHIVKVVVGKGGAGYIERRLVTRR
jgi:hypothetical protein